MVGAKYKLGKRLAEPTVFEPTVKWQRGRFKYLLDTRRHICSRIGISPHLEKPEFFELKPIAVAKLNYPRLKKTALTFLTTSAMAAVCLLIYPYYPAVKYKVEQSLPQRSEIQATQPVTSVNMLTIPKIGVKSNILESQSLDILDKEQGVWHQAGGIKGNFVLAGHRFKYLPPNTTTFYNLNKLVPGDTAVVDYGGQRFIYVIKDIRTIKETETSILASSAQPMLTLYTCSDKRETERIVVRGELLP